MLRNKTSIWARVLFLAKLVITFRIFQDLLQYRQLLSFIKMESHYSHQPKEKVDFGFKVSIIIPAKNEEKQLPGLLDSIFSQTYKNLEIIVVDDDSTDNTQEIAKRFGAKYVHVTKDSVGYSSNVGAKESSGDILIRCDADTRFTPRFVEEVVTTLIENSNAKIVIGGHYFYDGNFIYNFLGFLYDKYWRPPHGTPGYMTAIRRDAYFNVGGYDASFVREEDWALGQKILAHYGNGSIVQNRKSLVVFISSRNIRKYGFYRYVVRRGMSFSETLGKATSDVVDIGQSARCDASS